METNRKGNPGPAGHHRGRLRNRISQARINCSWLPSPLKASFSDRDGRARMGRAGLDGSLHSRSSRYGRLASGRMRFLSHCPPGRFTRIRLTGVQTDQGMMDVLLVIQKHPCRTQ